MKNNWQTKKLGEICKIQTGRKDVNQGNPNGKYPFFTCANQHTYSDSYSFDTEALLIAGNGDVGNVNFYKGKFEAYQRTYVLTDFKLISTQFLYIYLNGYLKENVSKLKLGNTMPYIKLGMLSNFEVIIPPIIKQKEIVDKIKNIFENIGKAKENTEKNLQNSKELFESFSQNIFANKDNKWKIHKLDDICKVERGSSPRPIKKYITNESDGVNWIKIGDTKKVSRYLYKTNQKITKDGAKNSRFVKDGDIILSNSMSYGKPYIMKTSGYIHDGWFVLRPNENLNTEYFYDAMMSPQIQDQMKSLASGAIVKNISGDLVKQVFLPIPLISEQLEIVKKLDELSEQTKKLEENYKQKLLLLDELKKSVLAKAFSGGL